MLAERGSEDSSKKPLLAEALRKSVLDPLSTVTAIRQELRRGNRGTFTVPVYDGARRFDVRVRVLPKKASTEAVLHLELTLAPIAGFKGESSDDGDPDNAPRPVALTISDDPRLVPLRMSVAIAHLPLACRLLAPEPPPRACSRRGQRAGGSGPVRALGVAGRRGSHPAVAA